jgi:GT2 family glycosyltransferase
MHNLSSSIVLYNTSESDLQNVVQTVLQSKLSVQLYLIDNSPTDKLRTVIADKFGNRRIEYIFNNKNIGFGKAHNIALRKAINNSRYHLVLNPDIEFEDGVLEKIYAYLEMNKDVGQLLPKVFYDNGHLQKLCHLLPKPFNLIGRRFFNHTSWSRKLDDEYGLTGFNYDRCLNIPNLSGCFMFLRCSVLKQVGFFDERYFMYMEDIDLCRRIHRVSKTMFYPGVSIVHGFEKESYNNPELLKHHIFSAIKYFNKWGWFFDKERTEANRAILKQLNEADIMNDLAAKTS